MSDPCGWTALETAAWIRDGKVSAREVANAHLDRIAQVEPRLNSLSEVTGTEALRAADLVDAARAAGDTLGPMAGVPITIKNNVDQVGTRNTGGIHADKDTIATEDSPLVANLRAAGAVIVGRSNVPAFSFRWFTDTDLHGRTLNPHGDTLSPGGSSGGAGASLAAGIGAMAHGNDIGGSIRQPALVNGVAGLRPTVGRLPSYVGSSGGWRGLPSQLITTEGPLARSVADLRLGANVMAGHTADPRDPAQVPMPAIAADASPARHIGIMGASSLGSPAPEVAAALSRAADALQAQGAELHDISLPHFEEAFAIWCKLVLHAITHHQAANIAASGDAALIRKFDALEPMIHPLTGGEVLDLWARRLQIQRDWSLQFVKTPVVLLPVSYRHALQIDADQVGPADMQALFADQSPLLATALLGNPCLSIPTGLADDGAPMGVQLAARWWDEATLLGTAEIIEKACPPITPI